MMNRLPLVSIIIAANRDDKHLRETVKNCLKLDYPHFEIIVVSTEKFSYQNKKVKVFSVGNKSPAYKRGFGVKKSNSKIIAFIDDDAYPRRDWLINAIKNFNDESIVGVGGPAVTPPNDSLMQRAGGHVLESRLGSGSLAFRYFPKNNRFVDDFHSCNLILRRDSLKNSWFNSNIWPGEDTQLVFSLVKSTGKKVLYDNNVIVYHHRRSLFKPHLKQIYGYASHRGYFVRVLPETSRRFTYFIPSIFFVALLFGLLFSFFSQSVKFLFLSGLFVYSFGLLYSSIHKSVRLFPIIFLGIFLTHFVYGFGFIKGFFGGVKH